MGRVILAVVMTVALSGCFYQTVNQYDIERAAKICGSIENIVDITSRMDGLESVICHNGEKYHLKGY